MRSLFAPVCRFRRGAALATALLILFAPASCSAPATFRAIHNPLRMAPIKSARAELAIIYSSQDILNVARDVDLPGGQRGLIFLGGALDAALRSGLSYYFQVQDRMKYTAYIANVGLEPDSLRFEFTHERTDGGYVFRLEMSAAIGIVDNIDGEGMDVFRLRGTSAREVGQAGAEAYTKVVGAMAEEILSGFQRDLHGLLAKFPPNRYKPRI